MPKNAFIQSLLTFLDRSPTPFHAVTSMQARLDTAGFTPLIEGDEWMMEKGQSYYVTRNGSSIIAFKYGKQDSLKSGLRLMGAHTDSPCLKVKPNPEINKNGYLQLGVEVYGGALLNPWFDRDLSMAGRVSYLDEVGKVKSGLVNFKKPIAILPSLAIHLDREANKKRTVNPQTDLPVILRQVGDSEAPSFTSILQTQLQLEQPDVNITKVLDYEIALYDTQSAAVVGLSEEFIASARLDNLLSCFIELEALINSGDEYSALLVCNDHEEVGSASAEGAAGPFLEQFLMRVFPDVSERSRIINRSMMISVDNAHGIHPNYADKHDANHGPLLNKGPVIKQNANQRYATNSETSSLYKCLSEKVKAPYQSFVVRTDMACGSTIGPITAAGLGVKTIDIGVPQFAMHSIRELAGVEDSFALCTVLQAFCDEGDIQVKR